MTSIQVRNASADDLLDDSKLHGRARIVHADPPWNYRAGKKGHGRAADHYEDLSIDDIVSTLYRSSILAAPDAYLLMWCTFPQLWDFVTGWISRHRAAQGTEELAVERPWSPLTGGAWDKTNDDRRGIGYHFLGECEPLLVFKLGKPRPIDQIGNCWQAPRGKHSEKPQAVLEQIIESLTERGDLVVDLYAGETASLAQACLGIGRDYVGAELSEKRASRAQTKASQGRLDFTRDGPEEKPAEAKPATENRKRTTKKKPAKKKTKATRSTKGNATEPPSDPRATPDTKPCAGYRGLKPGSKCDLCGQAHRKVRRRKPPRASELRAGAGGSK